MGWAAVRHPVPAQISQEVLVSFIDGDPDKPIITGRVYNADNSEERTNLPFPDPDHAKKQLNLRTDLKETKSAKWTRSGIKTHSTLLPDGSEGPFPSAAL